MNISKSSLDIILLLYALYKPYDKITTFMEVDGEMPAPIRLFFDKFENHRFIVSIFKLRVRE